MRFKLLLVLCFIFLSRILFSQAGGLPDILSVDPSIVYQNQSYNLYLNTVNFDPSKISVNFGDGIALNSLTCSSPYSCSASISVSSNAYVGTRDIIINYKERTITATAKITVQEVQNPDILSINPSSVFQGQSYNLSLNTINFDPSKMSLDFGSGIVLNGLSCQNRNFCNANISVSSQAEVGIRDVKIIYGSQTFIATAKISVEKEQLPDILSANPSNLNQGMTYDLSLQVSNFDPYKMSLNFGSGTKINNLTCPSKYSCICNISISNDAEGGLRDIKIQYKEKTIVATAKITIIAQQPPDILSANPSILEKEKNYNLNLSTVNFDSKTMQIDFGAGITVNSLNCTSPYICTTNISVQSNAVAGVRDIKIKAKDKTYIATAKITIEEEKLPDVVSANPSNLFQGESYSLVLNTLNFDQKKMSLSFGEGIEARNLNCPSTSLCNLDLKISENAKAGVRDIKIRYKEKDIIASAKLNIQEPLLPDVLSSNPSNLVQGESYNLNLNTLRFNQKKMGISFGEDIKLNSLNCQSESFCNANISVASNAKYGLKDIIILYKEKRITATAKLTVSESQEPDILSANPSSIEKGKEYSINLNSLNFDIKTMQIDIGSGFEIKKFNCVDKFNCSLDLKVLGSAKEGEREIFILYKNKRKIATAKLNVEKEKGKPKFVPTTPPSVVPVIKCEERDTSKINKSKIDLLEPFVNSISPNINWAPVKEGTIFKWKEKNLGLAEWFEFRILWNDKIIWKKKIERISFINGGFYLPDYFKVTSDFLNEMASTDWKKATSSPQGGTFLTSVYGVVLQWQVAGFKNYPLSCIFSDLGPKKEVEVEISDKWNFALPNKPTGLECKNAKTAPGIKIQNLDASKGQQFGNVSTQNFPQDRIEVSGTFDFQMSPYAPSTKGFVSTTDGGKGWHATLSNLILDWGDGSINYVSVDSLNYGVSFSEALGSVPLKIEPNEVHKYSKVGKYKIRLFMLSEEDLQGVNPAVLASSYDSSNSNPYWSIYLASYRNSNPSILQLAERAYMIFCEEIEISPIEDLVAKGPLHLENIAINSFNGENIHHGFTAQILDFSNCQMLQPGSILAYYGKGNTSVRWYIDDMLISSEWPVLVGPSRIRENLTRQNFSKPTNDSIDYKPIILSSPLNLENLDLKNYQIKVEVQVGLEEYYALSQEDYYNSVNLSGIKESQYHYASLNENYAFGSSNTSYSNFGFLSPLKESAGFPPYVTAIPNLPDFSSIIPKEKPYYVTDNEYIKVSPSTPDLPCKFLFKTKSGDIFEIGVYNKVKKQKYGKYEGSGDLLIKLYVGSGFYFEKILKIGINDWEVDDTGNVLKGEINEILSDKIEEAGMVLKFEKIKGRANETDLELTLTVKPQDSTIRITGKTDPPEWKSKSSRLDGEGNWLWEGQDTKELSIGSSGFKLVVSSLKIDLSSKEGEDIGTFCGGGTGTQWAGINFDNLKIIPYTFELNSEKNLPYEKVTKNWGIVSDGLCGKEDFPPFYSKYKSGSISFEKIEAEAKGGNFKANYKNMDVEVPWLEIHMKGNGKFVPGSGSTLSHIDLTGLLADKQSVSKNYGNISFIAKNFKFGSLEGVGWATKADVFFDFKTKGVYFAENVPVPSVYFDMDYRAYFDNNISSKFVNINQSSYLGKSPVFVKNMVITNNKIGNEIFGFTFDTSFSISSVLPTVSSPVSYSFKKESQNYFKSIGPKVTPFEVEALFPQGQPEITAKIKVEYNENPSLAHIGNYENYLAYNGNLASLLFSSSGPEDYFKGEVDLTMIGAPIPVKAEFRLGYWGGDDYFLIRTTIDLGPGVQLGPIPLKIYKLRGGLGHNFPIDAFQSVQSIMEVQPKIDNSYIFMAGMRIGTSDKMIFVADGDFTIKIGEGARMDFRAWLLKEQQSGEGDVKGYFQYAGGAFDGSIWTPSPYYLIPSSNLIWLNVPQNSTVVHFGSDNWLITAGKKEGPRIQGHLVIADADSYFMLGSSVGFKIGGSVGAKEQVGNCSSLCAWIEVGVEAEFGIDLNPLHIKAESSAHAGAGGCAYLDTPFGEVGGCKGFGVSATLFMEAPSPLKVYIKFSVDPPIPCLDSIDVYIQIIPPGFDIDTDWCV